MLPYRDSRLVTIAIVVFFILVCIYAYFEARGLLFGPHISVSSAPTEVHDPFILIKGKADRISGLTMQGAQVQVTEDGSFSEPYLLSPGINRIVLEATDTYGRHSQQSLEILYTPASSTPASTETSSTTATTSTAR